MDDDLALDLDQVREMRRFYLVRHDPGPDDLPTGLVAVGVVFPDPNGRVVLGWLSGSAGVETYGSVDALMTRHERHGSTEVVFPTDLDD